MIMKKAYSHKSPRIKIKLNDYFTKMKLLYLYNLSEINIL